MQFSPERGRGLRFKAAGFTLERNAESERDRLRACWLSEWERPAAPLLEAGDLLGLLAVINGIDFFAALTFDKGKRLAPLAKSPGQADGLGGR